MDRRPLTAGMSIIPNADQEAVRQFVGSESGDSSLTTSPPRSSETGRIEGMFSKSEMSIRKQHFSQAGVTPVGLIPVTVRLQPRIAGALKRASLQRQLAGETVHTQQDLVQEALEPWLREHGYLA